MKFVIAYLCCFIVQLNLISSINEKPKIAIIGSGIGGAACAMFLNKLLGHTVEISIYEANKEGGRINTIIHKGNAYELGAQTILQQDKLTNKYVDYFRLKKVFINKNKPIYAVYDGRELKQMIYVNNLTDGFRISDAQYQEFSTNVDDYNNHHYKTVLDMLKLITKKAPFLHSARAQECLKPKYYARDPMLKECEALLLMVYGQLIDVPALPGFFTVKSVQPGAYSIQGGNIQIIDRFLSRSMLQNKYKETVVSIRSLDIKNRKKSSNNDLEKKFNFEIESVDTDTKIQKRKFDIVVMATPLTKNMKNPIQFLNFSGTINVSGEFHKKFITILEGDLESQYFNQNKNTAEKAGHIIFRSAGNIDFISKLGSVKANPVDDVNKTLVQNKKKDGASTSTNKGKSPLLLKMQSKKSKDVTTSSEIGVWKIQSKRKLSEEELVKLFLRKTIIAEKEWLAYPNYEGHNLDTNDSFVISPSLYYINCIEWAASSIEMSIVGAKNVALKIYYR